MGSASSYVFFRSEEGLAELRFVVELGMETHPGLSAPGFFARRWTWWRWVVELRAKLLDLCNCARDWRECCDVVVVTGINRCSLGSFKEPGPDETLGRATSTRRSAQLHHHNTSPLQDLHHGSARGPDYPQGPGPVVSVAFVRHDRQANASTAGGSCCQLPWSWYGQQQRSNAVSIYSDAPRS